MSRETEGRPKRRLFTFWRVVAVIALAMAGYALWRSEAAERGPHVARYELLGLIASSPDRSAFLRELGEDAQVAAVVLRIDSPGGTTTGSEELFADLRGIAARKPVVAVMGEVAASGGYIAALGADHVIARGNTLTGSIGVISQSPDLTGLLEMVGVDMRERRSSPFKAAPSPFSDPAPEVEAWEAALIDDSYQWFRGLVADRRGLSGAALDAVADGRVFTGRQALANGLIDELGGLDAARLWLEARGIDPGLPLRDRAPPEPGVSLLMRLLGTDALARAAAGLGPFPAGRRLYSIID